MKPQSSIAAEELALIRLTLISRDLRKMSVLPQFPYCKKLWLRGRIYSADLSPCRCGHAIPQPQGHGFDSAAAIWPPPRRLTQIPPCFLNRRPHNLIVEKQGSHTNKASWLSGCGEVIGFHSDSHWLCPPSPSRCCNLRATRSARLLGFSLYGAMLFSDHVHTVRPVIKLALCICVIFSFCMLTVFQTRVKCRLKIIESVWKTTWVGFATQNKPLSLSGNLKEMLWCCKTHGMLVRKSEYDKEAQKFWSLTIYDTRYNNT